MDLIDFFAAAGVIVGVCVLGFVAGLLAERGNFGGATFWLVVACVALCALLCLAR